MMAGHGLMWSNIYQPETPKVKQRVDWKRLGALFAPYWRQQATVLVCIVVVAALGLVPGFITAHIIDSTIPNRNLTELGIDVGIILASALLTAGVGVVQGYLNSVVGEGIMRDIRTNLVAHLHRMPLQFFTGTKTGEIMNRVSNDVDNVDNVVTGTLTSIVTNFVLIATTVVAMFVWNWRLALLSVIIVPLMVFPLGPVGRRMYQIRKRTREKRDEIESITQETLSISGITLIKSFAREAYERARFYRVGTNLMQLEINLAMVGRWFLASVTAMVVVGPAIVWFGGGWMAIAAGLQVGVIVAFVSIHSRPALRAGRSARGHSGADRQRAGGLRAHLRLPRHDAGGVRSARSYRVAGCERRHSIRRRRLWLRRLARSAARHLLEVRPGEVAAFVGPSGAGKTTITGLVPRFYDPQQGRVLVDGHDVRTVTLESLRRDIGIVTQETYLFHDTIANNLRYGKPDATDAELQAAARAANIADFIAALPARLRYRRWRARAQTLGRRASATGHRAGAAQRSADSHPRRSDELARLRKRSGDSESARSGDARPHQPGDRPSSLDDAGRRRHLRRRRRPDRRSPAATLRCWPAAASTHVFITRSSKT